MNIDGSKRKTIVTDCRLPDDIIVDAAAGHDYWTNMVFPTSTTSEMCSDAGLGCS
jgi:hypothetical protein